MAKLSSKSKSKINKWQRSIIRSLLHKQKRLHKYLESRNDSSNR